MQLGAFRLDLRAGELSRKGYVVRLQEQPFVILRMLVERPGEVVLREEIRKRLWPNDTLVDFDHSVNAAINKLREALGDSARSPSYVETVARRGYRLIVPVEEIEAPDPAPPSPQTPPAPEPQTSTDLTGAEVGHYRVLELLGAGGMGVVYQAEDLKLRRSVALKFPSPELWSDPAHRARLEREARAGARLDHPNICTVYEVGEHQGKPYLAMQLLHGQTLRRRIDAGPIPLPDVVRVASQVAAGLEAAHRAGLVHGDVKPANIFLTASGEVKILDFGLASHAEEQAVAAAAVHGGTAIYMSPEQVQGTPVDARSDLYSLGLVIYEMATGRKADSVDPAFAPAPLRGLIARALEPDRTRRFQSAAEMRAALAEIQPPAAGSRKFVAAAAVILVLAVAAAWWLRAPRLPEERALTSNALEDAVSAAAISPDGSRFAFSRGGSVWVQNIATGQATPLAAPPKPALVGSLSWSPDGSRLYGSLAGGGIFTVPTAGAELPVSLRAAGEAAAVAPDGQTIAFLEDDRNSLSVMRTDGSAARQVFQERHDFRLASPVWTASGVLLFAQVGPGYENCGGWISSWNPGTQQIADILQLTGCIRGIAPLPGGRLLYLLRSGNDGELYEMRIGSREAPRRLIDHTGAIESLSAPLSGGKLLYRKSTPILSVYAADLEAGPRLGRIRRVSRAENNSNYVHGWTADSRSVLFESIHDGQYHLFRKDIEDGGPDIPLPGSEAGVGPQLSPDGAWILFNRSIALASGEPGSQYRLMRMPAGGGNAVIVADEPDPFNFHCARAPANACVVFSAREKPPRFRVLDPAGGVKAELLSVSGRPTDWDLSPDGTRLAMVWANAPRAEVRVANLQPQAAERVVPVPGRSHLRTVNWSADGRGFLVCADETGSPTSALLFVGERGAPVVLRMFDAACPWAVPSPDGSRLAFSELHDAANVRLIDLP